MGKNVYHTNTNSPAVNNNEFWICYICSTYPINFSKRIWKKNRNKHSAEKLIFL